MSRSNNYQHCPPKPIFRPVVGSKIYLAQGVSTSMFSKSYRLLRTSDQILYHPFCDDFGPMNMLSVIQFIRMVEGEIASFPSAKIVYYVEPGRRELTNAIFLVGAFMMIKLEMTANQVLKSFEWLEENHVEHYRDATFEKSNFDLTLIDCWRGLERGIQHGWIRRPTSPGSSKWGEIDVATYEKFDDPNKADLHEVVPGKLIAFKGPRDLDGRTYFDDANGYRHFSPQHCARILKNLDVQAVVRLNESEYDAASFATQGIAHHHLEFQDCTTPPRHVIESFLRVVDGTSGAVAVHCRAGLGRTGTLIALYMMRSHGFSARESIGWLRIMRPGSVIGEQQRFLCHVERAARGLAGDALPAVEGPEPPPAGRARTPRTSRAEANSAAALAAQVAAGLERRGAARMRYAQPPAGECRESRLPAIRPTLSAVR